MRDRALSSSVLEERGMVTSDREGKLGLTGEELNAPLGGFIGNRI